MAVGNRGLLWVICCQEISMASFYGHYDYAIDQKGRVNVPARFRKAAGAGSEERYVITLGLDQCIYVYPPEQWEIIEKKLRGLSNDLPEERRYIRIVGDNASDSKVDSQGRITLPKQLLNRLGIDKKVVIMGAFDHIEIWRPETHAEFMEKGPSYEEVAEKIFRTRTEPTE
jgi:MraZ protein